MTSKGIRSGSSSKQRKSTSKRLRFEVFKRDSFTCQYCGAQPPTVVLECDHIEPVSAGGMTTADNLLTACESCNRGKSNIPLGDAIIRPDADLMWLQTQQEIAELKRYQEASNQKAAILLQTCQLIQAKSWMFTDELWAPSDGVLLQMLDKYDPEIVEDAVLVVAKKIDDGEISSSTSSWLPYLWGVAKRIYSRSID